MSLCRRLLGDRRTTTARHLLGRSSKRGDRSLDLVRDYMKETALQLPKILWKLREDRLGQNDKKTLEDVANLFCTFSNALLDDGPTDLQISFKRRPGRPRDKSILYLRWRLVAEHIDRTLADSKVKVETAIIDACQWSGLQESQVKAARSMFGKVRRRTGSNQGRSVRSAK